MNPHSQQERSVAKYFVKLGRDFRRNQGSTMTESAEGCALRVFFWTRKAFIMSCCFYDDRGLPHEAEYGSQIHP